MLVTIAIVVVVLLAALLAYAATRPDTFLVKRAQTIQAPPERIYPAIADFRNWASWSPFEKLDPAMTKTFSGALNGKGAKYKWVGNDKAGEGQMEIVEAVAPTLVRIQLDFQKPFQAHNIAEFTLDAKGTSTDVTWAMHGPRPFLFKVMTIFISMDKMVGKDFEQGLANLKALAESNQSFSAKGA
jgi:uncharacterized protein YndB with AHSA1/START domain